MNVSELPEIRETLTPQRIKDLVDKDSPTILEIGSHEGSDTLKIAEAMPNARIHCFECDQRAISRFKKATAEKENIFLYEAAIGDVNGNAVFFASTGKVGGREDWDFSGSLNEPTGHYQKSPKIKFKHPSYVKVIQLDTWASQITYTIDFIWADIQGAQLKMLRYAHDTLAHTRFLYIECHEKELYKDEPSQQALIDCLYCFGFTPLGIYGKDNILFKNEGIQ